MPELTVTPDPESRPPSVRVRVDADEDTLITRAQVRRDGEIVRGQVADRTPRLVIDDYEMPYATEVEYSVEGESVPTDVPLLDELWGDLAEWDGDTGDWVLPASEEPVAVNEITDPFMTSWDVVSDHVTATPTGEGVRVEVGSGFSAGYIELRINGLEVEGGADYRVDVDGRSDGLATFAAQFGMEAHWKDASDSELSVDGFPSAQFLASGEWGGLHNNVLEAPNGAVSVDFILWADASQASEGDVIEFRHPILTRGADPVDFFTGDSDDTGRWKYEWSGVPGESTSLKFDKDQTPTLHSDVDGAAITHTTDVPFNTVTVNNPLDVMVELIEVTDTEEGEQADVAVTIRSTGSGTTVQCVESGTVRTNGKGTYTATIYDGTLEVSGDAWTLSQPCTSTPSRVRITAMPAGHHYLGALDTGFALGASDRIAVSDAYVFVLNYDEEKVYRFDLDGGNPMSWSLPGACSDIAIDAEQQHVWVSDYDHEQVHEYEPDGTLVQSIDIADPIRVRSNTLLAVTRTVNSNALLYLADIDGTTQYINFVDQRGDRRAQIEKRTQAVGHATNLVARGEIQGDMWATIPSTGRIRAYRYLGNWRFGRPSVWTSQATDIALAPYGQSSTGWQKFELWGDHVREVEGAGIYTNVRWPLQSTAHAIEATPDGQRAYTVEGDRIAMYGPLAEVGQVVLRAIDAQIGEEFSLSQTVTLDAEGAWLIHASRPTALSVRIDKGQHRYDHQGVNVAGASAAEKTSESNVTVHHAPGAEYAVVNRWGVRPKPTWTLSLQSETWAARDQISALLKDQQPVLFRAPEGWQWDLVDGWYSVGEVSDKARIDTRADLEGRLLELPLTAVKRPAVVVSPAWTYDSVLIEFASLEALEQSGVSWLELLLGDV